MEASEEVVTVIKTRQYKIMGNRFKVFSKKSRSEDHQDHKEKELIILHSLNTIFKGKKTVKINKILDTFKVRDESHPSLVP